MKFITAPNGYGKTTILDLLEASIRQEYSKMFSVPFASFVLYYEESSNEYEFSIERDEEKLESEDTDIVHMLGKTLTVILSSVSDDHVNHIEQFKVHQALDGTITKEGIDVNTQMFFVSRTCYYLTDDRLVSQKMDVVDEILKIEDRTMPQYPDEMREILSSEEKTRIIEAELKLLKTLSTDANSQISI